MDRINYIQDQARSFGKTFKRSKIIKADVNTRFIYDPSADTDIKAIKFKPDGS